MTLRLAVEITGSAAGLQQATGQAGQAVAGMASQAEAEVAQLRGRVEQLEAELRQMAASAEQGGAGVGKGMGQAASGVRDVDGQVRQLASGLATGGNPINLLIQQGLNVADVYGPQGLQATMRGFGASLMSFVTNPVNLALVGFGLVSAAASKFFAAIRDAGPDTENILNRQRELLREIQTAFGDIVADIERFGSPSPLVLRAQGLVELVDQQLAAVDAVRSVLDEYDRRAREGDLIAFRSHPSGGETIGNMIANLRADGDLVRFFDHIARTLIEGTNPASQAFAEHLIKNTRWALEAGRALAQTRAALDAIGSSAFSSLEGLDQFTRALETLGGIAPVALTDTQRAIEAAMTGIAGIRDGQANADQFGFDLNSLEGALAAQAELQARILGRTFDPRANEETTAVYAATLVQVNALVQALQRLAGEADTAARASAEALIDDARRSGLTEEQRAIEDVTAAYAARREMVELNVASDAVRADLLAQLDAAEAAELARVRERFALDLPAQLVKELTAYKDVIAALDEERVALGRTEVQRRIEVELRRANVAAGSPEAAVIAAKVEALYAEAAAQEAANAARDRAIAGAQDFARAFLDFGRSAISDIDNIGEAFGRLLERIADLIWQLLVVEPLMKSISAGFGSGAGGGGFWSDVGNFFLSLFGGGGGGGAGLLKKAGGGWIAGPGGPMGDAIPAWLSDGEFVVNAFAARRHPRVLEAINAGAPGFAAGGWAGAAPANDWAGLGGGVHIGSFAPVTNISVPPGTSEEMLDAFRRELDERDRRLMDEELPDALRRAQENNRWRRAG